MRTKVLKCGVKRGGKILIAEISAPEKANGRWTGRCEDGKTSTGDTAEEAADALMTA